MGRTSQHRASGISPAKRREYASGFVLLGMTKQASAELSKLEAEEMERPDTVSILIDLKMAEKQWGSTVDLARAYVELRPREEKGWISWGYALRELQRIEEAREVLLRAEALHGKSSALLHYNLACYFCLLGDPLEAKKRLERAVSMAPVLAEDAKSDPDLKGLQG